MGASLPSTTQHFCLQQPSDTALTPLRGTTPYPSSSSSTRSHHLGARGRVRLSRAAVHLPSPGRRRWVCLLQPAVCGQPGVWADAGSARAVKRSACIRSAPSPQHSLSRSRTDTHLRALLPHHLRVHRSSRPPRVLLFVFTSRSPELASLNLLSTNVFFHMPPACAATNQQSARTRGERASGRKQ